jgi:pimeloyl-ACP methyl ester carboxylesterase
MTQEVSFVDIDWAGRPVRIEHQWLGASDAKPLVVFLHEGLGSLAMWKDFPERLCSSHGLRGFVFSRYGYGASTPKPADVRWPVDFMHRQAWEVLPPLFAAVGIARPWLFGHSDGASIALLYAARHPVAGLVVAAPHIFTEDMGIARIAAARDAYETTDWRARLARYHADVDSAFRGWNDVWLDPAFRAWNIEAELDAIDAPLLAVQGEDDEYGTLAQIRGIERRLPQTRTLVLAHCAHSPHRDQPDRLIEAAGAFIRAASAADIDSELETP